MREDMESMLDSRRSRKTVEAIGFIALSAYFILSSPLFIMFVYNHHFRHVFFNLTSHYRAKIISPRSVHVGDSITAGGGALVTVAKQYTI